MCGELDAGDGTPALITESKLTMTVTVVLVGFLIG